MSTLAPGAARLRVPAANLSTRAWPPETMRADNFNGLIPDHYWDQWTRTALERFANGEADAPVLFFGDSITAAWLEEGKTPWEAHFAPLNAVNFGIPGSLTQNLHWLLDNSALASHPPVLVVQIGINNVYAKHDSPRDTALGVYGVLRAIHHHSPRSRVVLLGLYPPNKPAEDPIRLAVEETNRFLAYLSRSPGVRFVDLGARFQNPDGSPRSALYKDDLHLTSAGYETVAAGLVGPLGQILDQAARIHRGRRTDVGHLGPRGPRIGHFAGALSTRRP